MLDNLFIKGLIVGFCIAMPVGPIAMLCIRHSLIRGMIYGLAAGLGAALADTLYGVLAAFGISMISHLLSNHQIWFQLIGAVVLCYLGVTTLLSKPKEENEKDVPLSLIRIVITTLFLTLTNPLTFLGFAGIYAGFGICLEEKGMFSACILTSGVFIGSAVWWLLLSCGTAKLGKKMNYKPTQLLNTISGSLILACGFIASVMAFQQVIRSLT